ncbi:hypothetical protein DUNSADRAFT_18626 [Dunaliella salina]|uniref:Encoded protein n=1 Tax=Dunaliella salina TaxID=3046 RepID=A0ABQ7FZR7_DUNSA|nr:hypothetical protein DUNSADRAFT_18626 [Dunaliella salina]|eukprot:KAF5827850.1 hypothetical protein DUNSADRAFT_18626 [Dunaliella salina]
MNHESSSSSEELSSSLFSKSPVLSGSTSLTPVRSLLGWLRRHAPSSDSMRLNSASHPSSPSLFWSFADFDRRRVRICGHAVNKKSPTMSAGLRFHQAFPPHRQLLTSGAQAKMLYSETPSNNQRWTTPQSYWI